MPCTASLTVYLPDKIASTTSAARKTQSAKIAPESGLCLQNQALLAFGLNVNVKICNSDIGIVIPAFFSFNLRVSTAFKRFFIAQEGDRAKKKKNNY